MKPQDRYAWVEPVKDCPERQFILGNLIQLLQDAKLLSTGKVLDRHYQRQQCQDNWRQDVEDISVLLASDRFHWWITILGMDPAKVVSRITEVVNGKYRIPDRVLAVGQRDETGADRQTRQAQSQPVPACRGGINPPNQSGYLGEAEILAFQPAGPDQLYGVSDIFHECPFVSYGEG